MIKSSGPILDERKDVCLKEKNHLPVGIKPSPSQQAPKLPTCVNCAAPYGLGHCKFRVEGCAQQFQRTAVRVGVADDSHVFFARIKHNLIRATPAVRRFLALMHVLQDRLIGSCSDVEAEAVEIISTNNFFKAMRVKCKPCILIL